MKEQIHRIEIVEELLLSLGCTKVMINDVTNLVREDYYYKVSYISGLQSIVIESARNLREAELNLYEDSSLFNDRIEDEKFKNYVLNELKTYYFED